MERMRSSDYSSSEPSQAFQYKSLTLDRPRTIPTMIESTQFIQVQTVRINRLILFRVIDRYFCGIDSYNWTYQVLGESFKIARTLTIFSMEVLDVKSELSSLYNVVVELVPRCESSEFGTGDFCSC
jgi:hypothetical protein